jgi:hypothetical protein
VRRGLAIVAAVASLAVGACATVSVPATTVERARQQCLAASPGDLPPVAFTTDGCSAFPDGCWRDCCVAHDMAYWCGGSRQERARADREFRRCLACRQSALLAWTMWAGVRAGGHPVWPAPWRWGYGRPWSGRYPASVPRPTGDAG